MPAKIEPYKASFTTNGEMLYSISNIAYHLGRLSISDNHVYSKEDALDLTISMAEFLGIHATPSQFKGLLYGEENSALPELMPLFKLYSKLLHFAPDDEASLKQIEEAFFVHGVPNRLSRKVDEFPYPLPMHKKIDSLMKGLFKFAKANKKSMNPISLGCMFAYEIQSIAPYSKNNLAIALFYYQAYLARYCRCLARLNLAKLYIRHQKKIESALEETVEKGDMGPYLLCFMRLLEIGVNGLLVRSVKAEGKTSPLVEKMLNAMEENRFYSAEELCALLHLKSRLGLQRNYLRPALEAKLIVMSNPLVVTDRTQRYCKKGN